MNRQKLLYIVPFIILLIFVSFTWGKILSTEHYPTLRHSIGLGLVIINLLFYFFRFDFAIFFSGLLILLGVFNLLVFFPNIETTSYFIKIGGKELATPNIQWKMLLLFLLYCILIFPLFKKILRDRKAK